MPCDRPALADRAGDDDPPPRLGAGLDRRLRLDRRRPLVDPDLHSRARRRRGEPAEPRPPARRPARSGLRLSRRAVRHPCPPQRRRRRDLVRADRPPRRRRRQRHRLSPLGRPLRRHGPLRLLLPRARAAPTATSRRRSGTRGLLEPAPAFLSGRLQPASGSKSRRQAEACPTRHTMVSIGRGQPNSRSSVRQVQRSA